MTKTVYLVQTTPPLSREDLAKLFGKMHENDPLPRALRQIVQERLAQAIVDGTNDKLTERQAGIVAGRTAELLELMTEFADLVKPQPRQKPATTGNTSGP